MLADAVTSAKCCDREEILKRREEMLARALAEREAEEEEEEEEEEEGGGGVGGGGGEGAASETSASASVASAGSGSRKSAAAARAAAIAPRAAISGSMKTQRAVDLTRELHAAAAARVASLRLRSSPSPPSPPPSSSTAAAGEPSPSDHQTTTAVALETLRDARETLAKATTDVDALSIDAAARLESATAFREVKSRELRAAEAAVTSELQTLETRKAELEAELAVVSAKVNETSARASITTEERAAFEASNDAIRSALAVKARDLEARRGEYEAEAAVVAACASTLDAVARIVTGALKALLSDAEDDEACAKRRFSDAVRAHVDSQCVAMRLCLERVTFCSRELQEIAEKKNRARELGLGADVQSEFIAAARAIERTYVEAEEALKSIATEAMNLRHRADVIVPAATRGGSGGGGAGGRARGVDGAV